MTLIRSSLSCGLTRFISQKTPHHYLSQLLLQTNKIETLMKDIALPSNWKPQPAHDGQFLSSIPMTVWQLAGNQRL
jgi:hypothetical protein